MCRNEKLLRIAKGSFGFMLPVKVFDGKLNQLGIVQIKTCSEYGDFLHCIPFKIAANMFPSGLLALGLRRGIGVVVLRCWRICGYGIG